MRSAVGAVRGFAWVTALLVGLPACDSGDDLSTPPMLTLGGGDHETGFRELRNGDVLTATQGPRGGHVALLSMRVSGLELDPENDSLMIDIRARSGEQEVGAIRDQLAGFVRTDEGAERYEIFFETTTREALGIVLTFEGTASDLDGRVATDTLHLVLSE